MTAPRRQVIAWQDPPSRPPSKYDAVVKELRGRPKQWGLVLDGVSNGVASGLTFRIRAGSGAFAPRGAFEAKYTGTKGVTDARVFVRFVGEPPRPSRAAGAANVSPSGGGRGNGKRPPGATAPGLALPDDPATAPDG